MTQDIAPELSLLLQGGLLLDPYGELNRPPPAADLLIENGQITAIGLEATARAAEQPSIRRVDASGKLVTPGFVNAHYHSHDVLLRGMFEQMPLELWGLYSFPSNYPRRSGEEVRLRTQLGIAEALCSGVTTMQDMVSVIGPDREHVDMLLGAYRDSGVRAVVALQFADRALVDTVPFWREEMPPALLASLPGAVDPRPMQDFVEHMTAIAQPRLTWGLAPSAPQRCSEALLAWITKTAIDRGCQVFTHVYESKSQALLARREFSADGGSLIALLERMGLLGPHMTVAHGVWIADEEVERFGRAGANLAFNPISNLKLLNGVAPIRRYAEAGAGIGLGCDNCSGNDAQNIFESMKAFALYWGLDGDAGETGAAERAFRAATLGGARAVGLEGIVGSLRPGHRADIVLHDLAAPAFAPLNNAVRQLVYAAGPHSVDTVLVEGEVVVENGRPVRLAVDELARRACNERDRIGHEVDAVTQRNAPLANEVKRIHNKIMHEPLPFDRYRLRNR